MDYRKPVTTSSLGLADSGILTGLAMDFLITLLIAVVCTALLIWIPSVRYAAEERTRFAMFAALECPHCGTPFELDAVEAGRNTTFFGLCTVEAHPGTKRVDETCSDAEDDLIHGDVICRVVTCPSCGVDSEIRFQNQGKDVGPKLSVRDSDHNKRGDLCFCLGESPYFCGDLEGTWKHLDPGNGDIVSDPSPDDLRCALSQLFDDPNGDHRSAWIKHGSDTGLMVCATVHSQGWASRAIYGDSDMKIELDSERIDNVDQERAFEIWMDLIDPNRHDDKKREPRPSPTASSFSP